MKTSIILFAFLAAGIVFLSFSFDVQNDPWEVPDKYAEMNNPEVANAASLKIGKSLYSKHCASCHGKEGIGDGSKAAQLDTPCGDFTSEEFQDQPDGTIFFKSKFGRDEMPNYEKKIPYDEDFWHLVNYMRTLE